jgi:hypothetical protein
MLPQVIKNFLHSEKGVLALALLIGATVLASLDKMAIADWQEYSIWIFGIYTGGKSIQGAAAKLSEGRAARSIDEDPEYDEFPYDSEDDDSEDP